jgi:hypothetical protein
MHLPEIRAEVGGQVCNLSYSRGRGQPRQKHKTLSEKQTKAKRAKGI